MREQSENKSKSAKPKTGTKEKKKSEFEFCKVCKINHDQGLRHKYFPKHKQSLSTFLSRFKNKLSDVRFFLKTPSPLTPQLASGNRFWCVFCDQDIDEHSSSFACENAIRHLASVKHVNNLKHFFWKYGGTVDQLDVFTVSHNDVAKESPGAVFGPSSDIHNQSNNENIDSFKNNIYSNSVNSNVVLPLHCYTNEYQVSSSGHSGVGNTGLLDIGKSSLPSEACSSANTLALQDFAAERRSHKLPYNSGQWSSDGYSCNKAVLDNGKVVSGESGIQMLTRISFVPAENGGGNVHSGAPPPWFETTEGVQMHPKPVLGDLVSHSNKSGKHKKLNPKRVGAAWAEKRKIEMEMEKRGETVRNECDASWLPNFGRVWQSGSRRESRKEFEKEKQELSNVEAQPEMPIKIQPYVSKRMVRFTF
ncbi:putative Coiled-coil domain-containing protein [Medicago truncatula]|uniref:Putative Coiled-coil domain-containing protein n=1 Tax=Medicago truncatula TaxID=3880 RepID=A0A396J6H6_MEDTR|nr:putative Coiled-coil domain-containing protein [Medicago truncatula]